MRSRSGIEAKTNRFGILFVLPFILFYAFFQLWPTIYTFGLSFGNLKGLRNDMDFVGLKNFIRLVQDPYFWKSVASTFIMWGCNFVPQLLIAFIFAVWFSDTTLNMKGAGIFRAVFYLPNLLTTASVAILFRSFFAYPSGPVNQFLGKLGIWSTGMVDGEMVKQGFYFFRMPTASRLIVSFIQWWMWCGNTLILLMAGITSISPTLYEAAVIDGATSRQQTFHITLPLLRPMMFYILITSMIGGMQLFEIPFLLTGMHGEPDFKIRTMAVYLYNIGFQGGNDYSYAATIAIGIFIITVLLSFVINAIVKEKKERR